MRKSDHATLTIPTGDGKEQISLLVDRDKRTLITASGSPLDRKRFVALRDRQGAAIFADDPALIRRILRFAATERGIFPRD